MTLQDNSTSHYSYDAVVVGGGIIGKSTIAFELARSSVRVLLIYAQQQNSDGTSLASVAMLGAYGEITAD
jgi:glycine/D-amino acid oxidase-like deaminating enzyme